MEKLPEELQEIVDYLQQNEVAISEKTNDGRINSAINEQEIIDSIQNKFNIIIPNIRQWYDIAIELGNTFYPINIKVTESSSADNLNCKLGIYYALTGIIPNFNNGVDWGKFLTMLESNFGINQDKDYYFLIVNKKNHKDVFATSLKALPNIVPNGNNLPFQCRWDSNRIRIDRTFDEAAKFIMTKFAESIKLRADMYFIFNKLFPEYAL